MPVIDTDQHVTDQTDPTSIAVQHQTGSRDGRLLHHQRGRDRCLRNLDTLLRWVVAISAASAWWEAW
ncbi:hypothetical protein ACN268_11005 [Micromonospora sp. WMMD735]|uniref:hypothetical protein n=1 Tax=Micromonospora sp. WMMD735 TaxID=3404130 RepID=UPI003B94AE52